MSQRSRKTQKSLSQPSTSTYIHNTQDDMEYSHSQVSPNKTLSNQEHAHYVSNAIKYILTADFNKVPIAKSTISKSIECTGKNFNAVIKTAKRELRNVFGYDLIDVDNGKYILCNTIVNDLPHMNYSEDIANNYILLFLSLIHIYMCGEECTEDSLIAFLTNMGIITDGNIENNETFGNIINLITVTFVKEKYIEKVQNKGDPIVKLKWGVRARNEISIRTIMEFVSKVCGRNIQSWPQQYEQMLKREREENAQRNPTQGVFVE